MKFYNLIFLVLLSFYSYADETEKSEFVVSKSNKNQKNISSSKLKEQIINYSSDVLDLELKLNEVTLKLRKFLFAQMRECLAESKSSIFSTGTKNQLKDCAQELENLKNFLENQIENLQNQLNSLKKKFIN